MTIQDTLSAMHQMNFEGNVIPHTWYQQITFENKKPQLNAIIILAEIVYWYRPKIIKDEATGKVIGMEKRFKADLLQRSYESFSSQFGLSKKQVRDAFVCLENLGVIGREFRNITTQGGVISNVLFIRIYPDKLNDLTHQVNRSLHRNRDLPTSMYTPIDIEGNTYTENTTQTTTDIPNGTHPPGKIKKQPEGKPLTILSDEFTCQTGISVPADKTGSRFWWSQIQTIYQIAGQDVELGKELIKETKALAEQGRWTILGPQSMLKTMRGIVDKVRHKSLSDWGSRGQDLIIDVR